MCCIIILIIVYMYDTVKLVALFLNKIKTFSNEILRLN